MCLNNIVKIRDSYQSHKVNYLYKKKVYFGHIKYDEKSHTYYRCNLNYPNFAPILGYKLLDDKQNSFYFNEQDGIKLNHVYECNSTFIESDNGVYYPSGFHILWSLRDTQRFFSSLLTSRLSNVYLVHGHIPVTYGIDSANTQVVVCKAITFIKKIGNFYLSAKDYQVKFKATKDA